MKKLMASKRYAVLLEMLAIALTTWACSLLSTEMPIPTSVVTSAPSAALAATANPASISSPTPTPPATANPTSTSSPLPTATATTLPTPTSTPLPPFSDFSHTFDTDIYPLSQSLSTANRAESAFISTLPSAGKWEVILVPDNPRLYYVQENLFPKQTWGTTGASYKLYLEYWHIRNENLYFPGDQYYPVSQDLNLMIQVVAEVDKKFYNLGILDRTAGVGLANNIELVDEVVKDILILSTGEKTDSSLSEAMPILLTPSEAQEIQTVFKEILGYTIGMDQNPNLPLKLRLALLELTLDSSNWSEQYQAAQALGALETGAGDVLPKLFTALAVNAKSDEARDQIFRAIYAIQPNSLPIPLSGTLPRFETIIACGIFQGSEPFKSDANSNIPSVIEGLKGTLWETRALSAMLLGEWVICNYDTANTNIQSGWDALSEAQSDENPIVRMAATLEMRGFTDFANEAIPLIVAASSDPDTRVRLTAVIAMGYNLQQYGQLKSEQYELFYTALVKTMSDPDAAVRLASVSQIYSVDKAYQSIVIPGLIKALTDENPDIRQAAANALFFATGEMGITGKTPQETAAAWQKWWEQNAPKP